MWSTESNTQAFVAAGLLAFSTYSVPTQKGFDPTLYSDTKVSNLSDHHWVNTNIIAKTHEEIEVTGIADIISFVKVTLGLPNKDIASIFHVTRMTLHTYSKDSDVSSISSQKRERFLKLNELTKEISEIFEHSPGAMAKNYTIAEDSLLDLLSQKDLNIKKIIEFSQLLAKRMHDNTEKSSGLSNDSTLHDLTRST